MRRVFAGCIAFLVLLVIVVVRFGFRDPPSGPPMRPIPDAALANAPIDAAAVLWDAAPIPKKHPPKPRPAPKSPAKPTPVIPTPAIPLPMIPTPVIPTPGKPRCTQPPNPPGCPATEPNINRPCDTDGVHCVYGTSCCPPVYVCNNGVFEAWFTTCP